jgi:AraC-like DNA-binding protein
LDDLADVFLRIETAMADVAEEAGFGSPQAFSRIFKKETGMTPRAYRLQTFNAG